jgi:2-keto-4-pentenoate hydratase/2-oxohepta-3-ene-1,7-dioic acid hydratase in catechol pathway
MPPGHLTELHRIWQERFGRSEPEKIVCVGLNYRDHAAEQGAELPAQPLLFAKFPSSLSGPGDPIVIPPESTHVDAEAELAVVIGVEGRRVPEGDALGLVAGYTAANDVTARDLQSSDGQWLRAKGFDTFCPVLPTIVSVSELGEAADLRIVQTLNGDVLQDSSTAQLIFGVGRLVAHASTVFTLRPGDLILTGTPAGVGVHRKPPVALSDGDVVEVEIEGIGALANPVVQG